MITRLDLQDEDTVQQLWQLQHIAYRIEAELIGFTQIPPLQDTFQSLQQCEETFYGWINEEAGELIGAVAVESEEPGTLTVTRMMVHPDHFREGIAHALLSYVLHAYSDVHRFIVSTGTRNIPAFSLYTKHGFKPVSAFDVAPGVELTLFHLEGPREGSVSGNQ
ncbi:GNAT family N-acetyltransferase [Paenibacillus sp. JX-17]|uniref:GNAT family N-acetyltransferase n=1 Tax=Paenibacillus lacisoli TaxID=3064525 RepID=A0ABT9CJN1_9BACL|nr:GNAT family N-acetyltransferase [Paenibacillus sp. JX-17]MDO7907813.1 GNAT family N-acetyltransferase [Paenibacillus sp. JX-17]